ncbi:hypothetical protein BR63_17325 [Thermanaerosceptrum fracticalcis]|uniref:Uncharacterized protein n=1 Tax=Thermanaerosceptrum fracticalcis TaxID=1712410 RepID=A0A7G6E709_THEFR|nr:hypothetical protein [Thermanaerosceptrum fracticalcis]QNB47863.1 hypothetical protein BR63_17325 [Thermanaerosceptrum fracticalcis]
MRQENRPRVALEWIFEDIRVMAGDAELSQITLFSVFMELVECIRVKSLVEVVFVLKAGVEIGEML